MKIQWYLEIYFSDMRALVDVDSEADAHDMAERLCTPNRVVKATPSKYINSNHVTLVNVGSRQIRETSNPSEEISHGICKKCAEREFPESQEKDSSNAHPDDLPPKE